MMSGHTIGLVIPCHNEAEGLQQLLPQVPKTVDTVLVVDNNSTDETAAVAKNLGATVIFEKEPGYGRAYQAGLAAITTDIVVTLDGDGQYPPQDIERLVRIFLERKLDFLSANRFPLKGQSMPALRQTGNHLLTAAARLLFDYRIEDTQSGMWIFWRKILETVKPTQPGMPFSEELKIKTLQAGFKFGEEHIVYLPRIGTSKLVPWKDGWENLQYLIQLRFRG